MNRADRNALLGLPLIVLIAIGLALGGSQGGNEIAGFPIFAFSIALAFVIQWIAFIPAFIQQTETFYDLTGSITYLSVVISAVLLSPTIDGRSILLLVLVSVWAIRLGTFLFRRILAEGFDRRFTEMKPSLPRFLMAWTLQGLWVSFSLAAALAAITSSLRLELGGFALAGLVVWILGFAIEVIADRQKSRFRKNPDNAGKFISSGLWGWSRHPNYFGEITLWIGVALIAFPVLRGWQWVTMISPLFIILLLTRISGVPLLEASADERWGGQPAYESYKAKTSVLIPWPPASPE